MLVNDGVIACIGSGPGFQVCPGPGWVVDSNRNDPMTPEILPRWGGGGANHTDPITPETLPDVKLSMFLCSKDPNQDSWGRRLRDNASLEDREI